MPLQNSANAVIMVLTYFKALGPRSLCEGGKNVFITPRSLTDFEPKSCSFCLCLEVEGYSGNYCSTLRSN